ncbi:hypothetical protein [Hydrocarboniphaga effusa]|uniref:hypothetical protein n=1 Tax=Hydrocarboniphaga effusa TaxID=243629 RepID=UPI003137FAA9
MHAPDGLLWLRDIGRRFAWKLDMAGRLASEEATESLRPKDARSPCGETDVRRMPL